MKISEETFKNILKNTQIANKVWSELNLPPSFYEHFHLRPTNSGITIVSTFPYAPMRGLLVQSRDELKIKLTELLKDLKSLCSEDTEKAAEKLAGSGFAKRCKEKDDLEENIQALFIKGLILKDSQYDGIVFVASEFTAQLNSRIDVIGFKDGCLYIFELKKGRTTKAAEQLAGYIEFIDENLEMIKQILEFYPNYNVKAFEDRKGICVMRYAVNQSNLLKEMSEKYEVGLWSYEDSLSFRRIVQ